MVQLPAASLELTDEVSDEDALQMRAYRELLFPRPELELVNGAVQAKQVPLLDANGNPGARRRRQPGVHDRDAAGVDGGGQCARLAILQRDEQSDVHQGMLSTAELRLLSEWLDIGAQYYNDPFPPTPQN